MIVSLQPFGLPAGIETAIGADSVPKGRTMPAFSRSERIRRLNDEFRTTLDGEKCLFTPYVADMGVPFEVAALEAVKAYKQALELDRDLLEAHFNLGCLWLEQNKPDAARTEFTSYTFRRGNTPEGWLKLGAAQLKLLAMPRHRHPFYWAPFVLTGDWR